MKILLITMKYNMGYPALGLSYEHYNFYDSLKTMNKGANEVVYFPFDEIMLKHGKKRMNQMLIEKVNEVRPDLCFFELMNNQIDFQTIKKITDSGKTITYNWYMDDDFRFDTFSKYYAKAFDWISTEAPDAVAKYHKIGCKNIIKTQVACNPNMYYKLKNKPYSHDIIFIGKNYGNRGKYIRAIPHKVDCYGIGWDSKGGRITHQQLRLLYNTSKISLNFAQANKILNSRYLAGILFYEEIDGSVHMNSPGKWVHHAKFISGKPINQVKGRIFEMEACGTFVLSEHAPGIEEYYVEKKEIVTFKNEKELVQSTEYYLSHDKERERIAKAGHERTIKEHTYEKRFNEIFKKMGL